MPHAIQHAVNSSDARILRRALDLLRPDVTDFFRFIDGEERHHFWGTGNLVRFAEGLVRIDIQNQVLFLLDNDAEGIDAYRKLQELKMPNNLRSMVLPEIEELRLFPALGPEGLSECDINGRAAAIECYLDLNLPDCPPARVIWSNYKREIDAWHGALEHKESYDRHFMNQDAETLAAGKIRHIQARPGTRRFDCRGLATWKTHRVIVRGATRHGGGTARIATGLSRRPRARSSCREPRSMSVLGVRRHAE